LLGQGQNALNKMKDIEKQLINKGFKNETLQKMLNLKQELLKLENAIQQQGEDTKRQSKSNTKDFNSSAPPLSKELKDYINSVEILNRQSLPLQPNFNQKVQHYFKNND
jgi:DNA mismatch repair ATPase MutS